MITAIGRCLLTLAALPMNAQIPVPIWANVPVLPNLGVVAEFPASLVVVGGGARVDLGAVDGDRPLVCRFFVENRGDKSFSVVLPRGFSATPFRVQVPTSTSIAPGGRLEILAEYDARLDHGPSVIAVVLATDDPGAPQVRQEFAMVVGHKAVVSPYRDLVKTGDTPVRFVFSPQDGGKFIRVALEDQAAPIALEGLPDAATGRLEGVATLDVAKAASGPSRGAVRVVGTTDKGTTAYFWLQWMVQN